MYHILRIIIAVIFIISGFVKAVDIKGFSFKLEEYFSPTVFNMPFLEQLALPLAAIVVALELLLGMMLLLKIKLKPVLLALIVLCVFFAFLTFYSAFFNKVTDCGCFGDAVKFTPWQSFLKDIVLLAGLLILWWKRRTITQETSRSSFQGITLAVGAAIFAGIMIFGVISEPLIDFRDYNIGTDIKLEKQKIAAEPSVYKTFYTLHNTKTNEEISVDQDEYINKEDYWAEGSPWEIVEGKNESKLVKQGYASEISKFRLEDEIGNDLTNQILDSPQAILVFSYKPSALLADKEELQNLQNALKQIPQAADLYEVSPTRENLFGLKQLNMDATAIKTIARSNPFVLTLQNGKIVEKQPLSAFLKTK